MKPTNGHVCFVLDLDLGPYKTNQPIPRSYGGVTPLSGGARPPGAQAVKTDRGQGDPAFSKGAR